MELDDVADDGAPVIASLPMGGGAVRGPGAGKLCVRWGLGNELRIVRARGPAKTQETTASYQASVASMAWAPGSEMASTSDLEAVTYAVRDLHDKLRQRSPFALRPAPSQSTTTHEPPAANFTVCFCS